ncbi:putative O-methyltransferase [Mytilinidion resinicola]|uniref:O-methyltransferase n=1 Tax=Mytilinidion resinicola TaxID=574789 RepID=A0A6A6Y8R4_9PEZI|nr:putative O-methyltransferase [Mytilinidion resinicola]KAF2805009.1 putative O-methyltransferase [Mytilinidion resinicola]
MSNSRIIQLAQLITSQTSVVDKHIRDTGLVQPSFNEDDFAQSTQPSPPEVERAKKSVIEATIELRQLLEGPMKLLVPDSNFFPLAAISRFNIASNVPINSSISFANLAEACGLLEHDLHRIIRYTAAHHHVFREPTKGWVAHTAASRLLAESSPARDVMVLTFGECWPAHGKALDAIAQRSSEPSISGYALANATTLTTFEFLSQNPARAQSFAGAMSSTSAASLDALAAYFDWGALPSSSTVVDVGGSQGHVSVHLAQQFSQLRFVVQDVREVLEGAEAKVPEGLEGRVGFQVHDFFAEQPVKGARVYLLRYVLHDWPDKYCIRMLRALVPALVEGAVVVLQEHVLPEPGTIGLLQEMGVRSMDAIMLSLFNSRERDEKDWRELLREANKGFVVESIERIKENPTTGVIVVRWT